jgi:hypothetical protein
MMLLSGIAVGIVAGIIATMFFFFWPN